MSTAPHPAVTGDPPSAPLLSGLKVIEAPGAGDPWRGAYARPGLPRSEHNYLWQLTGRNKRSLSLDLKAPAGRAVLERLLPQVDVFVTNLPLKARPRLGVGYETLVAIKPDLIYGSITGYGESGEDIHEKAYDHTAWWGRSGLMEQLRASPDGPPMRPPVAMGDHTTGLALYGAIVSALFQRERTGRGAYVGASLLASGAWINGCAIQAALGGAQFLPIVPRSETHNPMQCHYECADQRWIILYVPFGEGERGWSGFMRCIGLGHLVDDPDFSSFESRRRNCARLVGLLDAQMRTAQAIVPLAMAPGFDSTVRSPMWARDTRAVAAVGAPALGQHTHEILIEHGFSDAEIARLLAQGVVAQFQPDGASASASTGTPTT